jgi:hypothetical protein
MTRTTLDSADRQALYVVQSIHDVVAALELRRERYRSSLDDGERMELRYQLLDDIDRLSNLVNLLQSLPNSSLHSATQKALSNCLSHMRQRIASIGASLTLDKIRELRSQAEYSSRRHEHPWGKSYLLKEHFVRHLTNLRSLVDEISLEHAEDLRTSAVSINALIESDRRRTPIPSFFGEPDITPIAMESLAFGELPEDIFATA